MSLRLYNTLTRTVQAFEPLEPGVVKMYVCGPTVYDEPHLGHVRSAFIFDVLRRHLESQGVRVTFVRNVTDVDDKIIEKARQELAHSTQHTADSDLKKKCGEVAERYLKSYRQALERLGIGEPTKEPRATEQLDAMVNLISELLVKGAAYETKGGDVYIAVRKFPGYGRLSNRTVDELQAGLPAPHTSRQAGARVEPGEGKQDPLDFALWKAAKPGEPSWKSPWGQGRPGWHIECTAMSTKCLGDTFDIHGGGLDLVFPHHENEIAQAEAVGKPFARYWVHHGLLTVNREKMSKSLGNFVTVQQTLEKCGNADVLKLFLLGTHYRSPVDYSETNIEAAGGRFDGLYAFLERADEWGENAVQQDNPPQEIASLVAEFGQALDDDLNTPLALAALDKLANIGYRWTENWKQSMLLKEKTRSDEVAPARTQHEETQVETLKTNFVLAAKTIRELGHAVLGLSFQLDKLTLEQQHLIKNREEARSLKDFRKADLIRQQLAAQDIIIEDTERGPLVRRKR